MSGADPLALAGEPLPAGSSRKPFVNLQSLALAQLPPLAATHREAAALELAPGAHAHLLSNWVSPSWACALLSQASSWRWQPVPRDGMHREGLPELAPNEVGSWRASVFSPGLAAQLWQALPCALKTARELDALSHTDWGGHARWQPFGVSPLLRLIRYAPGGCLVPHYDAPYVEDARARTLQSLVIYLTGAGLPEEGGMTRFLRDPQATLPFDARCFADHEACASPEDVLLAVAPLAGNALVFDHRLLHDASAAHQEKVILRTDILFRKA